MTTKHHLRIEVKELSPTGTFEGALSVYNKIDLGGDLIEPGAFAKTIKEHGNEVPLLWQHKTDKPIGMLTLVDGPEALKVSGRIEMETIAGREAYILIKARIVKGLSIGYDTVKEVVEGGVRRLKEIRLWEGSIVTFPMNEAAIISAVKASRGRFATKADFTTEYAEIQLQEAAYQMWIALRSSLCSIPWASDLTREEKITASQACIDEFGATYMEFIPAYLDWLEREYGSMETMQRSPVEEKAGRKLSAATTGTIRTAHEKVKSATDLLFALLDDEAADDSADTSEAEAAKQAVKPEPVPDHSALFTQLKGALVWNPLTRN